jgi:hypothetical protein
MTTRTATIGSRGGSGFLALALAAAIGLAAIAAVPVVSGLIGQGEATAPARLGPNDDWATRHGAISAPTQVLTLQDDFGTRHMAPAPVLGPNDDFGTRHQVQAPVLGPNDDFGTRNQVQAPALGPNDDYATRH